MFRSSYYLYYSVCVCVNWNERIKVKNLGVTFKHINICVLYTCICTRTWMSTLLNQYIHNFHSYNFLKPVRKKINSLVKFYPRWEETRKLRPSWHYICLRMYYKIFCLIGSDGFGNESLEEIYNLRGKKFISRNTLVNVTLNLIRVG